MKIKKTIGIILVLCLFISAVFVPCFDVGAQISAQSYLDEQMEKNDINGVVYATKTEGSCVRTQEEWPTHQKQKRLQSTRCFL